MRKARIAAAVVLTGALTMLGLMAGAGTAGAASVTPIFVAGNPSCTSLGYAFGFKVDPPSAGTYSIDGINTVTVTTDGVNFTWSSTLGMDAVISKGGPNANVYVYDPPAESFGDTNLHSPINPSNGQPFGLSHIEFCFDYNLNVTKTATTTFTRTFHWDIQKSVTPTTWDLFSGDSGTSRYTVAVTKTGSTDSDWRVSGTIVIANDTPFAATVTSVSDVVSGVGNVTADCGVSFPHQLAAGGVMSCTYSSTLPDATSRTNTATVATSGVVAGGQATAPVTFGNPTTVVNGTVNVDDTNGGSWSFGDTGSVSYDRTFACDGDEGRHDNTATIRETRQSSSASVTVRCYDLSVMKDARTSLTRRWNWTIDKSADQSNLLLSDGQLFPVNYSVTVNASSTDSAHAVSGNIVVFNPAPIAARLNSVNDIVSPGIAATVNCPVSFPTTLAAGGVMSCTYSASLPDGSNRINTATATLQNHAYDPQGNATPNGTSDFSGSAAVSFANAAVSEVDECIQVSDTNVGALGTVCATDTLPKTFTYTLTFGKHAAADVQLECGDNTHTNTASFVTNDTGTTGSDSWTVNARVACATGCTLTPGYWKTHSIHGPAPYDDAWLAIGPQGADTTFFLSGKTYYQVLWTAPNGNAYYILAHAYIAAKLNVLNGASTTPAVVSAISSAETFFSTTTPTTTLTRAQRNQALGWATTLDNYNNGLIGPGHCSE